MKFKHKIKVKKKMNREMALHSLGIKERDIIPHIAMYNLCKLRILMCGIDALIIAPSLLEEGIITQEDIDNNMKEIKDKLANGESSSDIIDYYIH